MENQKFEQVAKAPTESSGSYYVRKGRNNTWYLMIETYIGGERKQRGVEQTRINDLGLTNTMTLAQARSRVREINKLDRNKKSEYRAKIFSAKRAKWQKAVDKIYFPPEIMESFLSDIYDSPGMKKKYQNRLVRCFEVVTEMIPKYVQILPHQYNSNIKKVVSYFCKQKYSISYSSDIIMVMNMWAKCYAKHKGVYADLIEKLNPSFREAINDAHLTKEVAVRKRALPITRADLENLYSLVDKSNEEDRIVFENGVQCLQVKQSKTVNKSGVRLSYKKIPVLNKEQEEALAGILNFPATRSDPEWMDTRLRIKGKKYKPEGHKFDCYSGRKGFIDLMLSPEYNQKLENISV